MRVLIQRVRKAEIRIEGIDGGSIGVGLVIFLGISRHSQLEQIEWLVRKILNARLFETESSCPPQSLEEISGDLLVVSQFTLHASTKKGNRPSFHRALPPQEAEPIYQDFVDTLSRQAPGRVVTGKFGAMMEVELVNEGPFTLMLDAATKE